MNLHEELELIARGGSGDSASHLRSSEIRAHMASRVRRGRAVRDVGIGAGSIAAVAVLVTAAVAVPRALGWVEPATTTEAPAPSPSLSALPSPSQVQADDLIGDAPEPYGALAALGAEWTYFGEPGCEAFVAPPRVVTASLPSPVPLPIPSALETGRLYGWGDDVLVGGYPHPVSTDLMGPDATEEAAARYRGGPALQLTGADGSVWVFGLEWAQRDDLPHDDPGFFISLSPVYDCSADGVIPPGAYQARLAYSLPDGRDYIAQLSDITVVEGVPSLPAIHAQG